jgi:hypothetical protein
MEKHWTIRDEEEDIVHHELIGRGGYGEVHKVSCVMTSADTLKLYDSKQQLVSLS